jgi:tripartite-type tricarboxylate transporter receptor subunit TctC
MMCWKSILGAVAALTLAATAAMAQDYPSRAITFIVPYPPGGSTDLIARAVADGLRERLGQTVIVENRVGGGVVGLEAATRAQPDGYTIVLGGTHNVTIAALGTAKSIDTINDLKPIGIIGEVPNVLSAGPSANMSSLKEVIAKAKAAPGTLNFAHPGNGTPAHLLIALLGQEAKIDIVAVPYRGNQPAATDVLGGHVPFLFGNLAGTLPFMEGGNPRDHRQEARGVAARGTDLRRSGPWARFRHRRVGRRHGPEGHARCDRRQTHRHARCHAEDADHDPAVEAARHRHHLRRT